MMTMIADMVMPLAQAAAEQGNFLSHFGIDGWATGGAATGLAAIWIFTKIIRKVVGTLFMFCIAYLVFKCCFNIDLAPFIQNLFAHFQG